MDIKINNKINPNKLITFNYVPTIVSIQSTSNGTRTKVRINTTSPIDNMDKEYYMTINNVTVLSTSIEKNAVGTRFLINQNTGINYARIRAYYLCRALLSTELINDYDIYVDDMTTDNAYVIIQAKQIGNKYDITTVNSDTPWRMEYIEYGTTDDVLTNSKVILSLYAQDDMTKQSEIDSLALTNNLNYITTLEKYYNKNGITFDISPILSNLTDNGNITEYAITTAYIKDGQYYTIGTVNKLYAINGYSVNNGKLFIDDINNIFLLQNVSNGSDKSFVNNTTLYYIDGDTITLSLLSTTKQQLQINVKYLNSAEEIIETETKQINFDKSTYNTFTFIPKKDYHYVDVELPNYGTVRYTAIKPFRYGDKHMTLYFFNSYGGVSFFPFVNISEERENEKLLYRHNNFGLYNNNVRSVNKVYGIDNEYTITLTTHYINKDAIYTLYDLNITREAWIIINNVKYEVIVDKVEIEETSNVGVYKATVKVKYSSPDMY